MATCEKCKGAKQVEKHDLMQGTKIWVPCDACGGTGSDKPSGPKIRACVGQVPVYYEVDIEGKVVSQAFVLVTMQRHGSSVVAVGELQRIHTYNPKNQRKGYATELLAQMTRSAPQRVGAPCPAINKIKCPKCGHEHKEPCGANITFAVLPLGEIITSWSDSSEPGRQCLQKFGFWREGKWLVWRRNDPRVKGPSLIPDSNKFRHKMLGGNKPKVD